MRLRTRGEICENSKATSAFGALRTKTCKGFPASAIQFKGFVALLLAEYAVTDGGPPDL